MTARTSSAPGARQRRHYIREESGRFAKAVSPHHHHVVQSTYEAAVLRRARAFTPDLAAAIITPQEGSS
jgi:hypothetical protein